jgi:hypothetical protein
MASRDILPASILEKSCRADGFVKLGASNYRHRNVAQNVKEGTGRRGAIVWFDG